MHITKSECAQQIQTQTEGRGTDLDRGTTTPLAFATLKPVARGRRTESRGCWIKNCGVQPGVTFKARHHRNQPDVFTQACISLGTPASTRPSSSPPASIRRPLALLHPQLPPLPLPSSAKPHFNGWIWKGSVDGLPGLQGLTLQVLRCLLVC